jgi:hypothetical protein
VYLPDTSFPNAGVNGIAFITADKRGKAAVHTVKGNNMLLPGNLAKDTTIQKLLIQHLYKRESYPTG